MLGRNLDLAWTYWAPTRARPRAGGRHGTPLPYDFHVSASGPPKPHDRALCSGLTRKPRGALRTRAHARFSYARTRPPGSGRGVGVGVAGSWNPGLRNCTIL